MLQRPGYSRESKPEPGSLVRLDWQRVLWEDSDAPALGLGLHAGDSPWTRTRG